MDEEEPRQTSRPPGPVLPSPHFALRRVCQHQRGRVRAGSGQDALEAECCLEGVGRAGPGRLLTGPGPQRPCGQGFLSGCGF